MPTIVFRRPPKVFKNILSVRKLIGIISIFVLGVFLGFFWPKRIPTRTPELDPLINAERITGAYIPDRFKVLSYFYQNTGNIQLSSHGEKFYGFIEINNPTDRYDFREFLKKNSYTSLPYIGKDSVLANLNYSCVNNLSYTDSMMTKGYYRIETTVRGEKSSII